MASPPMVWPRGIGIWPTKIDAEHAVGQPDLRVEVRVVHRHRHLVGGVLVGEGVARLDEVLGDRGHAVELVVDVEAVEVQVGADGQLVGEPELGLVAHLEVDRRGRARRRCRSTPRTTSPGARSQSAISAVRSNTLVPSAFTSVGSRIGVARRPRSRRGTAPSCRAWRRSWPRSPCRRVDVASGWRAAACRRPR